MTEERWKEFNDAFKIDPIATENLFAAISLEIYGLMKDFRVFNVEKDERFFIASNYVGHVMDLYLVDYDSSQVENMKTNREYVMDEYEKMAGVKAERKRSYDYSWLFKDKVLTEIVCAQFADFSYDTCTDLMHDLEVLDLRECDEDKTLTIISYLSYLCMVFLNGYDFEGIFGKEMEKDGDYVSKLTVRRVQALEGYMKMKGEI